MHVSVVDVTNLEQNLREKITLNSLLQTNVDFKVGTIVLVFGRYLMCRDFFHRYSSCTYTKYLDKKKKDSLVRLQ